MRSPDVIVVGVGRTGTSTIARILQQQFIIHMANDYEYSKHNPLGTFEDQHMMKHSRYLTEKPGYSVTNWLSEFNSTYRSYMHYFVGLKCNQLSLLDYLSWELVKPKMVIKVTRDFQLVINSMMKWREPKVEGYWMDYYTKRMLCMEDNLDKEHSFPVYRIHFSSTHRTDEDLEAIIKPWVQRLIHESV